MKLLGWRGASLAASRRSRGPAELRLTAAVREVRRRARAGWLKSLLQLAAEFNREAPL